MATATPRSKGIVLPDHTQLPCEEGTVAPGIVLPDHTQLPEEDGTFVKNFDEHPQSLLLTDSILPLLQRRHPDGHFAIGQDCGIYWKESEPPERGAVAPDWFYVPDVPPDIDGHYRHSYVLWKESIPPRVVLEFSSSDGAEERDRSPWKGKFWIYEKIIRPSFYAIFVVETGALEAYHLVDDGTYAPLQTNERGRFYVAPLGVELGVWQGRFLNRETSWMRWWDPQGNLLPTGAERAEQERRRADEERHRADEERQRAEDAQRRADQERRRADQERRRADQERRRADEERQRAERLAARMQALGIDPDSA